MTYCIDPSADEPILLINKHIGYDTDEGQGIDGALFQQELLQLDTLGKKRIQVWINSPGGVVMDGYNIYSTILKTKTPVDTYAVGGVASIAAVIFQAGRKRIMTDYSWLMYHNPFGGDDKEMLATMKESLVKMIEQRCKMTDTEVETMLNRTSFIPAAEALIMNLCDTIDESKNENSKYLKKISNEMPVMSFHNECNKVLNSIINNQTQSNMIKVCMRLGLNDAAPEDSIVKAIDAIENRAKKSEAEAEDLKKEKAEDKIKNDDDMDKLKAKLKKAEDDKAKADAAYDDCKSQLDAIEKDKAKSEEDAKKAEAKNMIENFAKIGRIKNEETVKLQWTNTALKLGIDEAKEMIESLPLNAKAPVLNVVENKLPDGEIPTTAIGLMAKLKNQRAAKQIK